MKPHTFALLSALLLAAGCGKANRAPSGSPTGGAAGAAGMAGSDEPPPSPHGEVPMHRLRGVEYQNSVADLLGVAVDAPAPDVGPPYEAGIDDASPWFLAATQVARELFAATTLPEPLGCVGADEVARDCALSVIDELGLRAFRRPLLDAEAQVFVGLYDALSPGQGGRGALEQVVRALLVSPAFLFHVELSDTPDGGEPEPLDSYALAARLSFALWSTTPDRELLQAAEAGLTDDTALASAYERLASDERVLAMPDGWGDVWLGSGALERHSVDVSLFPTFSEALQQAMLAEQRELLRQLWLEPVPLRQVPTLELSFVTPELAEHYGLPPGSSGFVSEPGDARVGLLGQAATLTLTSFERRVSPSRRGYFVAEQLLCAGLPTPPPGEGGSLGADFPAGGSEREVLQAETQSSVCQACHGLFDPLGLALGAFDAVGAYRQTDSRLQPIDTQVTLPEALFPGAPSVDGLSELAQLLADSTTFHRCIAEQLASYLIHRRVSDDTDADLLWPLGERVAAHGSLTELTREIVMSDHFRYRRLAPTP